MRVGKDIVNGVVKGAQTAITGRRARDEGQEFELKTVPSKKKISLIKIIIDSLLIGIVFIGGYKLLTVEKMRDLAMFMASYKDWVLSITPLLGILITMVAGGSTFKHSRWSKEK